MEQGMHRISHLLGKCSHGLKIEGQTPSWPAIQTQKRACKQKRGFKQAVLVQDVLYCATLLIDSGVVHCIKCDVFAKHAIGHQSFPYKLHLVEDPFSKDFLFGTVCSFYAGKKVDDWKSWLSDQVTAKPHHLGYRGLVNVRSVWKDSKEWTIVAGGDCLDQTQKIGNRCFLSFEFVMLTNRTIKLFVPNDANSNEVSSLDVYQMLRIIEIENEGYEIVHPALFNEIRTQICAMKDHRLRFMVQCAQSCMWHPSAFSASILSCAYENNKPNPIWRDPIEGIPLPANIWDLIWPYIAVTKPNEHLPLHFKKVVVSPYIWFVNWDGSFDLDPCDVAKAHDVPMYTTFHRKFLATPEFTESKFREHLMVNGSAARCVYFNHPIVVNPFYRRAITFSHQWLLNFFFWIIELYKEAYIPEIPEGLCRNIQWNGETLWRRKSAPSISDKQWWREVLCARISLRGQVDECQLERFLLEEFALETNLQENKCLANVVYGDESTLCKCISAFRTPAHANAKKFCADGLIDFGTERLTIGAAYCCNRETISIPDVSPSIAFYSAYHVEEQLTKEDQLIKQPVDRPPIRQDLFAALVQFVDTPSTTQRRLLLYGATGCGKTTVAKALQKARNDVGYVNCNVPILDDELWPSILILDEVDRCPRDKIPSTPRVLIGICNRHIDFRANRVICVPAFTSQELKLMARENLPHLSPLEQRYAAMKSTNAGDARTLGQDALARGGRVWCEELGTLIDPFDDTLPEQQLICMIVVHFLSNQEDPAPQKKRHKPNSCAARKGPKKQKSMSLQEANTRAIKSKHKELLERIVTDLHGMLDLDFQTCIENLEACGKINVEQMTCSVPLSQIAVLLKNSIYLELVDFCNQGSASSRLR